MEIQCQNRPSHHTQQCDWMPAWDKAKPLAGNHMVPMHFQRFLVISPTLIRDPRSHRTVLGQLRVS